MARTLSNGDDIYKLPDAERERLMHMHSCKRCGAPVPCIETTPEQCGLRVQEAGEYDCSEVNRDYARKTGFIAA